VRSWSGPPRRGRPASRAGTTFVELLVTTLVLTILAGVALPIAEVSRRREKEIELRRALREIRQAVVMYHATCIRSSGPAPPGTDPNQVRIKIENDPDLTCYPKKLEMLVEGVETNQPDYLLRFLRRIPRDPFNTTDEDLDSHGWKLVSTTDRPEGNLSWDKKNVFDVRSGSGRRALDGSYYKDW
jgi:general secretion pathway protein G